MTTGAANAAMFAKDEPRPSDQMNDRSNCCGSQSELQDDLTAQGPTDGGVPDVVSRANGPYAAVRFSKRTIHRQLFRQPALKCDGSESEGLMMSFFQSGTGHAVLDNELILFGANEVHCFPSVPCIEVIDGPAEQYCVWIPYVALGTEGVRSLHHERYEGLSPLGQLIKSTLIATIEQMPAASPVEERMLAAAFMAMTRSILAPRTETTSESQKLHRSRSQTIRAYIRENLSDSELSAELICAKFSASRATIYREFQREGGVAKYIAKQRMQRAWLALSHSNAKRGLVRLVAENNGFADASSFSRAFRRYFGVSPTDLLVR